MSPGFRIKNILVSVAGEKIIEIEKTIEVGTGVEKGSSAILSFPLRVLREGYIFATGTGYVVEVGAEKYSISIECKGEIKNDKLWAKLRMKEGEVGTQYLDLVFGEPNKPHTHLGFLSDMKSLFIELRRPTSITGSSNFKQGIGLLPLVRRYKDEITGTSVEIGFNIDHERKILSVDVMRFVE